MTLLRKESLLSSYVPNVLLIITWFSDISAVTVIEVLLKDKKGKEEKTNILGQACIDLLPLLHGKCFALKDKDLSL